MALRVCTRALPRRLPNVQRLHHEVRRLSSSAESDATAGGSPTPPALLRSVLYVPGANEKAVQKARSVDADAVILDLEDGSGLPSLKDQARQAVLASLTSDQPWAPRVIVRINGLDSPWFTADVEAMAKLAAAGAPVAAVCLPKVGKREDLAALAAALTDAGAPPGLPLWAMIETPMGVVNAASIASSVSGGWDNPALPLSCLVAGTTDLTADLRAKPLPHRRHVEVALSTIVLAARAYGLACLDGVSLSIPGKGSDDSSSSFLAECQHGRALGFDGKTVIHPAQVTHANAVYGPTREEIETARRVLAAWEEAKAAGQGVAVLQPEGRLVENLHASEAQRVLALAEAQAKRATGPEQAKTQ